MELLKDTHYVHSINDFGSTPLHTAVANAYTDGIWLLVEQGADVNARDHVGRTPLMAAACVEDQNRSVRFALSRVLAALVNSFGRSVNLTTFHVLTPYFIFRLSVWISYCAVGQILR